MSECKKGTVYRLQVSEFSRGSVTLATFKASRGKTQQKFKGQVLKETGDQVLVSELDPERRHRCAAAGWGELA